MVPHPRPPRCAVLALLFASMLSCTAFAQSPANAAGSAPAAGAAEPWTDGEIRKVDLAAKKLTIRHGPIANLDMPPMTMVFQVRDAALLENRKPGDRIRFAVGMAPSGYVVTEIRSAP